MPWFMADTRLVVVTRLAPGMATGVGAWNCPWRSVFCGGTPKSRVSTAVICGSICGPGGVASGGFGLVPPPPGGATTGSVPPPATPPLPPGSGRTVPPGKSSPPAGVDDPEPAPFRRHLRKNLRQIHLPMNRDPVTPGPESACPPGSGNTVPPGANPPSSKLLSPKPPSARAAGYRAERPERLHRRRDCRNCPRQSFARNRPFPSGRQQPADV